MLRCIRCDAVMSGDNIDCPHDGISLRATGNYGSVVWDPIDDNRMFTAWLCDRCFKAMLWFKEYFMFEYISRKQERQEITMEQAMDDNFKPRVKKINVRSTFDGDSVFTEEELAEAYKNLNEMFPAFTGEDIG